MKKIILILLFVLFALMIGCNKNSTMENTSPTFESRNLFERCDGTLVNDENGIIAKFYTNTKGLIYGFELSGHANYAEYGEDIVCAAVSALALNTVYSIAEFTEDKIEFTLDGNGGFLKAILPDIKNGNGSSESVVLLNSLAFGLSGIQQSYGNEYIAIVEIKD